MTECGSDTPSEHILSQEDAVSFIIFTNIRFLED